MYIFQKDRPYGYFGNCNNTSLSIRLFAQDVLSIYIWIKMDKTLGICTIYCLRCIGWPTLKSSVSFEKRRTKRTYFCMSKKSWSNIYSNFLDIQNVHKIPFDPWHVNYVWSFRTSKKACPIFMVWSLYINTLYFILFINHGL